MGSEIISKDKQEIEIQPLISKGTRKTILLLQLPDNYEYTVYLSLSQRRAKASDPVLDATSSILEAFDKVTHSASRNSHNSLSEQASVNTAE